MRQLEQTMGNLEGGDLGLDEALMTYERGVQLLRYLYGVLDGAERTVALLRQDGASGTATLMPFDAAATAGFDSTPMATSGGDGEDDDLPY